MKSYNTTESDWMPTTPSSSPLHLVAAVNSTSTDNGGGLDLVAALWIFGAPVIFVVGICGNALVLVVTIQIHIDWLIDWLTLSQPAAIAWRHCRRVTSCNALVLVVMTRRRMSGTTLSTHLSVMAVADTMVLVSGLIPEWLEAFTGGDLIFKKLHPATCKLEKFVFYTRLVTLSCPVYL